MDTGKVYQDSDGNDCSITLMVRREPTWAAVRVQEGEKAIAKAERLERINAELLKALEAMTERYTGLVNCGDCGHWNPEEEAEVIQARAAIAKAKGQQ